MVGIDARSLAELGQPWPWARQTSAELIAAIADQGPDTIVVDILFAPAAAGDDELARVIAETGNVVLAEVVEIGGISNRDLLQAEFVTNPAPELEKEALGVAHAAVLPDPEDGVVRSVPLIVEDGRHLSPALALAALAAADDTGTDLITRPDSVQIGDRSIPTDDHYSLTVSYSDGLARADSPAVVSAADVLEGRTDPDLLAGKVVFVGVTDPTLGDHYLSPVARQAGMPGVLIHANAYNTMATRTYLVDASTTETLVTVFLITLLAGLAVQFLRLWLAAVVVVLIVAVSVITAFVRGDHGVVPNFVWPVIALVLTVPLSGSVRYALEARGRRRVTDLFSLYIPDAVAETLIHSGLAEEALAGQKVEVGTLFCDLRGFTAISAGLDPTQVRELLDLYYEFASQIILETRGTLMQYIGDEVFAIWGAPVPDPDHAQRAFDCACRMQQEKHVLDAQLESHGLPGLTFGIGVNSGEVVAAHAGSSIRRQYTVMGDAVNTGSRLCTNAGVGEVVVSDDVVAQLGTRPDLEVLAGLTMKGVREDFVAYRVLLDGVHQEPREAGKGK